MTPRYPKTPVLITFSPRIVTEEERGKKWGGGAFSRKFCKELGGVWKNKDHLSILRTTVILHPMRGVGRVFAGYCVKRVNASRRVLVCAWGEGGEGGWEV